VDEKLDPTVIAEMARKGITSLTGRNMRASFSLFFTPKDVVGIKGEPGRAHLSSTQNGDCRCGIAWLAANGIPKQNIIIWDRFDSC